MKFKKIIVMDNSKMIMIRNSTVEFLTFTSQVGEQSIEVHCLKHCQGNTKNDYHSISNVKILQS